MKETWTPAKEDKHIAEEAEGKCEQVASIWLLVKETWNIVKWAKLASLGAETWMRGSVW